MVQVVMVMVIVMVMIVMVVLVVMVVMVVGAKFNDTKSMVIVQYCCCFGFLYFSLLPTNYRNRNRDDNDNDNNNNEKGMEDDLVDMQIRDADSRLIADADVNENENGIISYVHT
mmetsp:Transcript_40119/g.40650  ORF Transcript_40119/g.40650 Transcript_40119/m.40650 type:complete len:114 (+) Transcript_40119:150-491(+)